MLDVQGCSKVTVKVNGCDALSSNRNSSLLGSETKSVISVLLLFDQPKPLVHIHGSSLG